jgi:hypothetical protein
MGFAMGMASTALLYEESKHFSTGTDSVGFRLHNSCVFAQALLDPWNTLHCCRKQILVQAIIETLTPSLPPFLPVLLPLSLKDQLVEQAALHDVFATMGMACVWCCFFQSNSFSSKSRAGVSRHGFQ